MAIVNRDLDVSEQNKTLSSVITTSVAASAGQSFHAVQVPWPCTLKAVVFAANSISGSPVVNVDIKRWTSGGVTTIPGAGLSLAILAYGASSAMQSVSLVASGSTLLSLQAGDVITVNQLFSGGNVSAANMVVSCVVQALQDIKQSFGQ